MSDLTYRRTDSAPQSSDSPVVAKLRSAWATHTDSVNKALEMRPRYPYARGSVASHGKLVATLLDVEARAEAQLRQALAAESSGDRGSMPPPASRRVLPPDDAASPQSQTPVRHLEWPTEPVGPCE